MVRSFGEAELRQQRRRATRRLGAAQTPHSSRERHVFAGRESVVESGVLGENAGVPP
jgi:hypothetical protein